MSPLREDESKSVCFSSGVIKGSYMVNQAVAACILSCEPHTTKNVALGSLELWEFVLVTSLRLRFHFDGEAHTWLRIVFCKAAT